MSLSEDSPALSADPAPLVDGTPHHAAPPSLTGAVDVWDASHALTTPRCTTPIVMLDGRCPSRSVPGFQHCLVHLRDATLDEVSRVAEALVVMFPTGLPSDVHMLTIRDRNLRGDK
jgi:hypothetical protein